MLTGLAMEIDGKLVADHFNIGDPWEIRLDRLQEPPWGKTMLIRFAPLVAKTTPAIYIQGRRKQRGLSVGDGYHLDNVTFKGIRAAKLEVR